MQWSISKRPHTLSTLFGCDTVKSTFKNIATTTKAYPAGIIFQGLTGSGKTTSAKIVAQMIVCTKPKENGDPCCECPDCKAIIDETWNRTVHVLDGASQGRLEHIEAEEKFIRTPSLLNTQKVLIVEEAQELSPDSMRYLLKFVESPRPNMHFIFTAMPSNGNNKKLPDAMLNRCKTFKFNAAPDKDVAKYLMSILGTEPEVMKSLPEMEKEDFFKWLFTIASVANGSYRTALQLLEQCIDTKMFSEEQIKENFVMPSVNEVGVERYLLEIMDGNGLSDEAYNTLFCGDAKMMEGVFSVAYKVISDAESYRLFNRVPINFTKKDRDENGNLKMAEIDDSVKTVYSENTLKFKDGFEAFIKKGDEDNSWKLRQPAKLSSHKNFDILRDKYKEFANYERLMPSHIRMLICDIYAECQKRSADKSTKLSETVSVAPATVSKKAVSFDAMQKIEAPTTEQNQETPPVRRIIRR